MIMTKYRITNYGQTRKLPYKGQYYELIRNCPIETEDEELAKELGKFQFVDSVVVNQPKQKKIAAAVIDKKIKRRKK